MQRLGAALGHTRLWHAVTHPRTRTVLRATRTVALAGSIGFAGYASGVHDALADPEGKTNEILCQVLKSHGGDDGRVLPVDAPDAKLVTRLGTELVVAAQAALTQEEDELQAMLSRQEEGAGATKGDGKEGPELEKELERVRSQLRSLRHNWRFVVIDDKTINAFVTDTLPGYVFIHRGLIDLMRRSHEQLSFIIGHELSHHMLEHNEHQRHLSAGLSLLQILVLVAVDPTGIVSFLMELGAMSTLLSYSVTLPSSRGHESEADALGLQLVVRACRDPRKAIEAHQTLASYERSRGAVPTTSTPLSATHPATLARLHDLKQLLPQAEKEYQRSGCTSHKKQLWRAYSKLSQQGRSAKQS